MAELTVFAQPPRVYPNNQSAIPSQWIPSRIPYSGDFLAGPGQITMVRAAFDSAVQDQSPTSLQLENESSGGSSGSGSDVTLLKYTNFIVKPAIASTPYLALPRNKQRRAFKVVNTTGDFIYMSYGAPLSSQALGDPIANNSSYTENKGTVSLDDIYISVLTVNMPVLISEGTISTAQSQRT